MMKKLLKIQILFVLAFLFCATSINSVKAATETEINDAIDNGLAWLATQQHSNGQFGSGYNPVAYTAAAVLAFENEGHFPGGGTAYSTNVEKGLDFIFNYARITNIGNQPAGNPDKHPIGAPNGKGVSFWDQVPQREVYETGMVMQAIVASNTPSRLVTTGPLAGAGWTYQSVMEDMVDWAAWGQADAVAGNARGGWHYYGNSQSADNSTAQWPVLGLVAAEQWGIIAPQFVKDELNIWINNIQNANGGSGYSTSDYIVNMAKTGGLLVEMYYVGDNKNTPRVINAVNFINSRWHYLAGTYPSWVNSPIWYGNKGHSYAMFGVFKGLELLEVDIIPAAPANTETPAGDWWGDYSEYIVNAQTNPHGPGSWPGYSHWNQWLTAGWYIVILQSTVFPIEVTVELPGDDCGCDTGYDIEVDYSVERFEASGTLEIFKDDVLENTVALTDFQGSATYTYHVASDDYGTSVWKAVMTVTGGGVTTSAEDQATLSVCESPVLTDIPEQFAPFVPLDLNNHLANPTLGNVAWINSPVPLPWTVSIASGVATVNHNGAVDPITITYTATNTDCCPTVGCSASKTVIYTVDIIPPVITAPDITVNNDEGECGAVVEYTVTVTDNIDPNPTLVIDHPSPDTYPVGVTTVTCTATDAAGNVAVKTFTVTVLDAEAPVITLNGDNPMEVIRFTPYVEPGAAVTDNCDPAPGLTITGGVDVDVNLPGSYDVTYDAVDASGNTSQAIRTVNVVNDPDALVCEFLFHTEKKLKVDKMVQGVGNMHSNDKIDLKKGPGTFVSNLWAIKKIDIDKDVTVDGDVTSGEDVKIDKNATVTGTVTEDALVDEIPLPVLSFTEGTDDVKLKKNETLTLPPGSYKKVEAEKEAILTLTTGEYFFKEFKLKEKVQLIVDVSTGPVVINATKKVEFDKEVTMSLLPLGEVDSRYVTINSMKDLKIDEKCTIMGSFIAPDEKVHVKKEVYLRGSICAHEIDYDKDGTALYHDTGSGVLPKSAANAFAENDKYQYEIQAEELPESYVMNQNYPNPFNPTTTISYQLPEASYVTLKIYDVLGNEIAKLAEGNRGAGSYTVEFNASNLSSGVYVYRLVANEFTQIKKMILSK